MRVVSEGSDECAVCRLAIKVGQRRVEHGSGQAHSDCAYIEVQRNARTEPTAYEHAQLTGLFKAMAAALSTAPAVAPERRCMGRRCIRAAEFSVAAIDESRGAHEYPVKLCLGCLGQLRPNGSPVDIFRWLTDNRIEASS